MSELLEKQFKFSRMEIVLRQKAFDLGFEVALGDFFRDHRTNGKVGEAKGYGHPRSCHKLKLAADYNLFKNGKYLTTFEDHLPLGEFWESIGGTWGGRFKKPDPNHYSLEHEGMK